MESTRASILLFSIFFICIFLSTIEARLHNHTKHKHTHHHKTSQISAPPSSAPAPSPSLPPSPAFPPAAAPAPENPPDEGNVDNSSTLFDVRKFGAVGDGVTDDTEAFKMAWDAACAEESATLLAPGGFSFMIQSTIFTGPCQGSLVFQVMYLIF